MKRLIKIIIVIIVLVLIIIATKMIFFKSKEQVKIESYNCSAKYELTASNNHKYINIWNYKFQYELDSSYINYGQLILTYKFNDLETYNLHTKPHMHIDGVEDIPTKDEQNFKITYLYDYRITDEENGISQNISIADYLKFLNKKDYTCKKVK